MQIPSRLIEAAVEEFAKLPGIGKKTALRLVLHLMESPEERSFNLSENLSKARRDIKHCQRCYTLSDEDLCTICENPLRDQNTICVVEGLRDVLAVENTLQYRGLYHVLGGVIAPIQRIGPEDLTIDALVRRIPAEQTKEVILALSPTMEGDTTAFYLTRKLKPFGIKITTIARGIPLGGELEYADELTLGRSIATRTIYDQQQ
jgi:recombination protein RecR